MHIHRLPKGNPKPFPLPYGIIQQPFVPAQNMSFQIHEISFRIPPVLRAFPENKARIIPVRYKADVLAFALLRRVSVDFGRNPAYFVLCIFPERQEHRRELFLRESVKRIRLVFRCRCRVSYGISARFRVFINSGVMPCGKIRRTLCLCHFQ